MADGERHARLEHDPRPGPEKAKRPFEAPHYP